MLKTVVCDSLQFRMRAARVNEKMINSSHHLSLPLAMNVLNHVSKSHDICQLSIYQTSGQCFSRALIGYSNSR